MKKILRLIKGKKKPVSLEISKSTRCLIVAPHPDDEIIGCGGFMAKYAQNCDVFCLNSSGLAYKNITAEERADMRIKEFHHVMDTLKIKNRWIFKIFGVPPFTKQIKDLMQTYLSFLHLKQYDYIFLPHSDDGHKEHRFITNNIFKKMLRKQGCKKDLKIVFYEVWRPLFKPNYYLDISDVTKQKAKLISLYKSQLVGIDYVNKTLGLNCYRGGFANNIDYAEAYRIVPVRRYL